MALRFLGGDTGNGGSPRLYREGDDYLVQGYLVTEPELLAKLRIPPGETVVRVPESLWKYLPAASGMTRRAEGSRQLVPGGGAGDGRPTCGIAAAEDQQARPPWFDEVLWDRPGALMGGRWVAAGSLSEYLWFDRAGISVNIETGARDRWRLGRQEPAPVLPGYDLRVLTGALLLSNWFTADGRWTGSEVIEDPALARQCSSAIRMARGISPRTGPHRRARQ